MNHLPLDRSALKWAVALLVTGTTCLSAAEGPMGKPLAEAFPAPTWRNENSESPKFPFEQCERMSRQGVYVIANSLNNQVVNLEIRPEENILPEKFRSRQEAWIEALFPGIAKENIKFHEPDAEIPNRQVITCKYRERSYLAIFYLRTESNRRSAGYEIRVGDSEYFTTTEEVFSATLGDDPGKKVIQSIFQTK